jgi:hypothetical protein
MGLDRSYVNKVLNGDKPLRHEFEIALPDDLEADYRRRQAEAHGLIVVAPCADPHDGMRQLLNGLATVLGSKLPAKAHTTAKADLPLAQAREIA